ncbi:hypothetical protein Syun_011303 [Stephania yunnanensis]|uniref:Uncharacterized protein n=1 Tax=Stephania yunnanensis TaxID=152371 RepID=A0AAP0JYI9_9MAGN
MKEFVVVFDFDKTIIDCDSDAWVVKEMGVTAVFDQLLYTMPWNSLMNRMMEEIHLKGGKVEDIVECLKRLPLSAHIVSAIKSAHALGCDLKIVSDANVFFIETILKHHGILDCFSEICSNPCFTDKEGKLRILPYHDFTSSLHGCVRDTCSLNMCKGQVIERMKAAALAEGKKRFIYLGDGQGDFCAILKLGDDDFAMPRKDYWLCQLIYKNPLLIKAKIREWSDGDELQKVLLCLINSSNFDGGSALGTATLSSTDCKFEALPVRSHGFRIKAW